MRSRTLPLLAVCLAVLLFVAWGCSKDRLAPTASAPTGGSPDVTPGRILKADDPVMIQAMKVQKDYELSLMADRNVVGVGTTVGADGRPALMVLTSKEGVVVPRQLGGLAVTTRFVGVVRPYAKPGGGGTLQMGTSAGNDRECSAGTLGCVVLKGGSKFFLSNNHVFARENAASNGERIDAPGRYDAHPICAQTPACGTLAGFKAISFSSNNTIDAAIAQPDPNRAFTCVEACGYTPSASVVSAYVGQAVKKCGRTSRLTTGSVQAINVTVRVQYSGGVATFVGQILTPGSFIRSGDSGSLMVESSSNNPVGLCFAGGSGGSFSNPIGAVLQNFGATICNQ